MLDLRNQFIMPPFKTGYCDKEGNVSRRFIDFYKRRAEFIGAVTPEPLCIDRGLRELPTQVCISDDAKVAGLFEFVSEIHAAGAKVIAHINHPGRMANPKLPGNYHVSSTDKPCENGGATPKRMDENDMNKAASLIANAAVRAEKAGFDMIELQFGHGYLMAQFLSPKVNDRTDEFGGSLENRAKFPLRVLDSVKDITSLPIIARISAEEMLPDGLKIGEMTNFAKMLEQHGVSAVHVSAGTLCSSPPWFFQHMFIPKGKTWDFARKIQKSISVPAIYVGKINDFKDVDMLLNEYGAKYLAVGRALVADPDFVGKYLGKVNGRPRPCLACSEGCRGGVKSGKGLGCVVNPAIGDEMGQPEKSSVKKKVAVVGGGLAGMQATLTLNERGHEVDIFEKEELGGQFNLAYLPPKKDSLKNIVDYYKAEISDSSVNVIKNEADVKAVVEGGYDLCILATGAKPAIPPVEGLKEYFWAEVLQDINLPAGKKIVIIGGGLIGLEIASKLIEKENEVIIVEMLDELARGMEMIEKKLTLKELKEKNIPIYMNTKVSKVSGNTCYLEGENTKIIDGVDHVIIATGMKSYNPLEEKLKDRIKTITIGDAKSPGKAQDAIRDGYLTAKEI